jgi:hypothetical protein
VIIVDPVVLGDVPFTRSSPKWVYDRTGTLVQVPANTLGVTYDLADLSKAPWALLEPESRNYLRNNTMVGAAAGAPGAKPSSWGFLDGVDGVVLGISAAVVDLPVEAGINCIDLRYQGTASSSGSLYMRFEFNETVAAAAGQNWASSFFYRMRPSSGLPASLRSFVTERSGSSHIQQTNGDAIPVSGLPLARYSQSVQISNPATAFIHAGIAIAVEAGQLYDFTIRIGLPQLERDRVTSPVKTSGSTVARAADVVGSGAGLVYSNVPMVETPYNVATTYPQNAAVYDPATKIVYWSMVAGNVGKALSDPAFWNKRTAINRWAMFDDRNSTQTSNPEEIVSVFSAQAITQGLFAGAMDASEVRVSMTHPTRGLVFSETKSLVLPRSGSSFYGWCFNRLRLRTWFLTLKLPVFANALVTVTIKKPGGIPKCGMCLLGPAIDVGLTLKGLSTELKDYSTTTFFTDGSSSTFPRGFSKKMSVDLLIDSDRVETIEDDLIKRRQKTLVFLGSTMRGDTMLVGRFSSLRKVIDSFPRSKMALQIDGVLSQ